jgi:hypothetical protein
MRAWTKTSRSRTVGVPVMHLHPCGASAVMGFKVVESCSQSLCYVEDRPNRRTHSLPTNCRATANNCMHRRECSASVLAWHRCETGGTSVPAQWQLYSTREISLSRNLPCNYTLSYLKEYSCQTCYARPSLPEGV